MPKLLDQLAEEREKLEKKLAGVSKEVARYRESRGLTAADVQKLLPADAALVDFLVYRDRVTAFVLTRGTLVRVTLKPAAAELAELVSNFRGQMGRTRPVTGDDDISAKLRAAVWGPLVPHLGGTKLVLVRPDVPLCRLPFAALPGADPAKYLIEETAVAVLPVPRLLPDLLAARPPAPARLLAVGGVDFDGDPGAGKRPGEASPLTPARTGGKLGWNPLPGSAGEVRAVEALFRKHVPGATVTPLTGGGATEAAVRRGGAGCGYLHFATHGFFDESGATLNAADRPIRAGDISPAGPNPAPRCRLVFAGANNPTPEDDGVLTALGIEDLDFRSAGRVVLSACETGLGAVSTTREGVFGLQRAFQLAGARATVTTLWAVSDTATALLMTRFYEYRLRDGKPALAALREAQLWLLNEAVREERQADGSRALVKLPGGRRTPPVFWAAFVLAGDWR